MSAEQFCVGSLIDGAHPMEAPRASMRSVLVPVDQMIFELEWCASRAQLDPLLVGVIGRTVDVLRSAANAGATEVEPEIHPVDFLGGAAVALDISVEDVMDRLHVDAPLLSRLARVRVARNDIGVEEVDLLHRRMGDEARLSSGFVGYPEARGDGVAVSLVLLSDILERERGGAAAISGYLTLEAAVRRIDTGRGGSRAAMGWWALDVMVRDVVIDPCASCEGLSEALALGARELVGDVIDALSDRSRMIGGGMGLTVSVLSDCCPPGRQECPSCYVASWIRRAMSLSHRAGRRQCPTPQGFVVVDIESVDESIDGDQCDDVRPGFAPLDDLASLLASIART